MWISSSIGQVEANSSLAYAAFRYLQRFVRDCGMLKFRYFKHTTWRERKRKSSRDTTNKSSVSDQKHGLNPIIYSPQAPHAPRLKTEDYLHDVELRQQVAVSQSKILAVQEGAGRGSDLISAILVDLVRKWGAEVIIQLLQSLQQAFL